MSNENNFSELVGRKFLFYGAAEHQFKLGSQIWEAKEDESDGYRSYLDSIAVVNSTAIFFRRAIAKVKIVEAKDIDGFALVDVKDGHVWLKIGTDHSDDYYPWFVFDYQPKAPKGASAAIAKAEQGQ